MKTATLFRAYQKAYSAVEVGYHHLGLIGRTSGESSPEVCKVQKETTRRERQRNKLAARITADLSADTTLLEIAKQYVGDAFEHEYAKSDITGELLPDIRAAINSIRKYEPNYLNCIAADLPTPPPLPEVQE